MIKLTSLNDLREHFEIPKEVLEFLKELNGDTECKRYDFGESCYVNVQEVETKPETPLMESHERYVDVQHLIRGKERIYYTPKEGLGIMRAYNERGDATIHVYDPNSASVDYSEGEAVVLYPEDAHLPNRAYGVPMKIKKSVIKISVKLIK